jgi:hypothetical protein
MYEDLISQDSRQALSHIDVTPMAVAGMWKADEGSFVAIDPFNAAPYTALGVISFVGLLPPEQWASMTIEKSDTSYVMRIFSIFKDHLFKRFLINEDSFKQIQVIVPLIQKILEDKQVANHAFSRLKVFIKERRINDFFQLLFAYGAHKALFPFLSELKKYSLAYKYITETLKSTDELQDSFPSIEFIFLRLLAVTVHALPLSFSEKVNHILEKSSQLPLLAAGIKTADKNLKFRIEFAISDVISFMSKYEEPTPVYEVGMPSQALLPKRPVTPELSFDYSYPTDAGPQPQSESKSHSSGSDSSAFAAPTPQQLIPPYQALRIPGIGMFSDAPPKSISDSALHHRLEFP